MKKFILAICLLMVNGMKLEAEIEMVQIKWNAIKCIEACVSLVEENLKTIPFVSNIRVYPQEGVAEMGWAPNEPFSYEPFRYAIGGIGLKIREMRVRVRGKIAHDSSMLYLVSNGDGTRFMLIGPIHTEPGRYSPKYNFDTHPLTPRDREELLFAERNNSTVLIEGPLYLPSHWPRVLIIEKIKVIPEN